MIDEKKFADEAMSDEELDNVAGGTLSQMQDLVSAIVKVKSGSSVLGDMMNGAGCFLPGFNEINKSYVKETLSRIGIDAQIDIGWLGYGICSEDNVYTDKRTGKSLSHEEVLSRIKRDLPSWMWTYLKLGYIRRKYL